MRRGMRKARSLKVIRYVYRLIDLNKYLSSLPGATLSENFVVTELKKKLLNSMPNICRKQAYVRDFDCESISFFKSVNMF